MQNIFCDGGYFFELQLFAEGAADGDSSSDGDALSFSDADEDVSSDGVNTDTDSEFSKLIRGRYKDAFTRKTQSIINKRFKETKALEEYRDKASPIIDMLYERSGVSVGDIDGLLDALNSHFTEGDAGDGVSSSGMESDGDLADDGEALAKEASGDRFRRDISERISRGAASQYEAWQREAEELSDIYPSFELSRECENSQFTSLLASGVSLRRAYESVHHDEIMEDAMEYTARAVSEAFSRNIQARGSRPFENGLGAGSGLNPKKDVSSLTDGDIMDIIRQVEKGKKISF